MAKISYSKAIFDGFDQLLEADPDVFILGQGLWSPWYVGSTMTNLDKKYGQDRLLDTPISENATTGMAIGAAMAGKRPIIVHPRMDFMLLAMDPIMNQASNWSYLFEGQVPVPVVIRSIINRGGEQGAQHSQAIQSFFMHIPGIKVVMPATPADAKGLLISAVYDGNPVIFIDDRWCYEIEGEVAEDMQPTPIGVAKVEKEGDDLTVVASSYMVAEALKASSTLQDSGVNIEVINLRTIKPWDKDTIFSSVQKTGQLVIADTGWVEGGIGAEIAASVAGTCYAYLKSPVVRVGLPNTPAPCARSLEEVYYPRSSTIVEAINIVLGKKDLKETKWATPDIPGMISY